MGQPLLRFPGPSYAPNPPMRTALRGEAPPLPFFFIQGWGAFGRGKNFGTGILFGEVLRPLGRSFLGGLGQPQHSPIPQVQGRAHEDKTPRNQTHVKISRWGATGHGILVNVFQIPFFCFGEGDRDPLLGLFGCFAAVLGHDFEQGGMDILGHPLGISTHVEVGALFQPAPELSALLLHSVLNVDLLRLIPGEGGGKFMEVSGFLCGCEFVAVKEVGLCVLIPKKEPVPPCVAMLGPMLEKGPKRCDSGPGADHDDIPIGCGQMKVPGGLDIYRDGGLLGQIGEISRGEPLFGATMGRVLDNGDGQVNLAVGVVGRRSDGVEPGGNFVQKARNFRGLEVNSRGILQNIDDIPVKNVLLQFLFVGAYGLQFILGSPWGLLRHRFHELFSDAIKDGRCGKRFVQVGIIMKTQFLGELTDECLGIPGEHAQGVPALVGWAGGAQFDDDVPGVLD